MSSLERINRPAGDSTPGFSPPPIFVKLGGSLITDKTREETPRLEIIRQLAMEVREALDARPDMNLVIGHGSGSFGHFFGQRFGTREGVYDSQGWVGYARVSAAAARLNRLVTDIFLDAGVPVLSIQPSASAVCRQGALQEMALTPLLEALRNGLVPMIYGDVALDEERGGTIISTEEIMVFLSRKLKPVRILLVGQVGGVLDAGGKVIETIRPGHKDELLALLGGSQGVDVTGGMFSKVSTMLELVSSQLNLTVRVFSGLLPGELRKALMAPDFPAGTLIAGEPGAFGRKD